jgi:uncharacterized protein
VTEAIWCERRKWPDVEHYSWQMVPIGEDEHGLWMRSEPDSPMLLRGEPMTWPRRDGVRLMPWGRPWSAWFLSAQSSVHPPEDTWTLYVDVVDEVRRGDDGWITMVDLDLDVVRYLDGRVELLDEDEFAEHQVVFGYPTDVIDAAIATSQWLMDVVRCGEPPFDDATPARWATEAGIEL